MAFSVRSILPYQPFKAVYLLFAIVFSLPCVPVWLLYYLPRFLRQNPKWTFKQAFLVRLVKTINHHLCNIEYRPGQTLLPGAEKQAFVKIQPSKKDIYRGPVIDKEIKPVEVGGTWYPDLYNPNDPSRKAVIIHFHGGAFVQGNGRKEDLGHGAGLLTKHTATQVFAPQYRLSTDPGCRAPCALQDAITAYQYVLELGVPSSSIVISGDSAGGNLALCFLRYIVEHEDILPKPRAALLFCPWVDPAACRDPYYCSKNRNYKSDFLVNAFPNWGLRTYAPPPLDPTDPYISPGRHPFNAKGVPIWIQVGSSEILADDVTRFAEKMRAIEGNELDLHEDVDCPHDIFILGDKIGFDQEATRMAKAMGEWLKDKI